MKQYFQKINKKIKTIKAVGSQGFTLVETLVAVSIFTVSILALMSVLTDGISDITYAKKKVAAAYLAQEGIEYVRNIRDTYDLYSPAGRDGWADFIDHMINPAAGARCDQDPGCYFDDRDLDFSVQAQPINSIDVIACGAECSTLLYDDATGKYGYESGSDSGFIRKIKVVPNPLNADEAKIYSTVFWKKGSGTYQLTFSETLFNWVE